MIIKSLPNILFIFTDQFRADALGANSSYASTPNLDRLAGEGVLFRRAYCNSPQCVSSRFSLALSRYPHQTGVWRNQSATLNPACPNWMQAVAAAGYRTSVFGKTHLHPHNTDLRTREAFMRELGLHDIDEIAGPKASMTCLSHMTAHWDKKGLWEVYRRDFEERFATTPYLVRPSPLPLEDYYDVYVGQHAAEYLAAYDDTRPWCCWVSFAGPHEPWDTPEPYASKFDPKAAPAPLPRMAESASIGGLPRKAFDTPRRSPAALTAEAIGLMRASYAGGAALIDDQIGAILEAIQLRGELDNTIVAFASDHGEMNGDQGLIYKSIFFEPVIRVPLILRVPPKWAWPRGIVSDALVELIDLAATLTDLAGSPLPTSFEGRSLRPILEGRETEGREIALCEYEGSFCLIQARWKAELTPDHALVSVFDLETDPGEQRNVRDTAPKIDWSKLLEDLLARLPVSGPPASIDRFAKRPDAKTPPARNKNKNRGLFSFFR